MATKKNYKAPAEAFITQPQEAEPVKEDATQIPVPRGYRLAKEFKSERINLLVRPATKDAIKRLAKAEGTSLNDKINQILDEYAIRKGEL